MDAKQAYEARRNALPWRSWYNSTLAQQASCTAKG